jgi:hypothetical protein
LGEQVRNSRRKSGISLPKNFQSGLIKRPDACSKRSLDKGTPAAIIVSSELSDLKSRQHTFYSQMFYIVS